MNCHSIRNLTARTSGFVLALACVTPLAFAGGGDVIIKQSGRQPSVRPVLMDTRTFFPQINESVSSNRIFVPNPSVRRQVRPPSPTGWEGGGLGANTTGTRAAMFPGISFNGSIPADPQIAVSKTHIVQVVNTEIAFFDKQGNKQFQADMGPTGFFSGIGAGNFVFDPKVFFDTKSGRFFVVILDQDDGAKTSFFCIAVSDDSNPNGSWRKFHVDNKYVDSTNNNTESWLDYEGWGYNKDYVVATGNMFSFGANQFQLVTSFLFKKSELLSGSSLTPVKFEERNAFTVQVAKTDDPTVPYVYGCALDESGTPGIRVYAWRLKAGTTDEFEWVFRVIQVPDFDFVGRPPSAGGAFLDSLSGRLMDATYRNGSLLTTQTTRAPSGNNRSQVSWYEFKPQGWPGTSSLKLNQSGNVAFAGDAWAFLAGINMNKENTISMTFTRSSSSIVGDIMAVSRKGSDPLGKMGNPFILAVADAPYNPGLSGRWGDYGSVAVDPSDDVTFWGTNMKSNAQGVWNAAIVSYKVAGDGSGGGGGGSSGIKPVAVKTLEGSFVAGTLTGIQTADTASYDTNAAKKADGAYATAVQTTFTLTNTAAQVADIDILVKGALQQVKTTTGTLFLWNVASARWDPIKSFNVTSNNVQTTATVSGTAGKYVDANKRVFVLFRALDPNRRNGVAPTPFKLKSDMLRLVVRTK